MTPPSSRQRTKRWDDSQPDLFIALPSDIPARDQQDLMERPFFSLSKNKRTTPEKLEFMKYDPVVRKHVVYKETKLK